MLSDNTPNNEDSPGLSILYQSDHIQIEAVPSYPGRYFARIARLRSSFLVTARELLDFFDAGSQHVERLRQESKQEEEKGGE